jgi:hypothetical protein
MAQQQGPTPPSKPDSFKLQQFGGMLPAWSDRLLPDGQAITAKNTYLFSGELTGWRQPKLLRALQNTAAKFAYRLPSLVQAVANATLIFHFNPIAGDNVFLGEETYTFTATVTKAYDVLLGATAVLSATNLFAAFTEDNGLATNSGTLYGTGTIANPAIDQTSPQTKNILATDNPRIEVFAPTFGAAYNVTPVATVSAGRMEWLNQGNTTSVLNGGLNQTFDSSITGASTWLEFLDPDTDVMRSPVVDDKFDRYYFASPSLPPQYNTRARIQAGQPAWLLGVPAPGCAPGVTVSGGGNTVTLGFPASVSANSGSPGSNIMYLVPVTPQGAMILNDVTIMPTSTPGSGSMQAVVYSDLNGTPHELLNVGEPATGITAGAQIASAFVNPTGLLMNVQYWIGYMTDVSFSVQFANDTGSAGVVSLNTFSNGAPPIINQLTVGYGDLQVWGDLTASSVQEARSYVYTYLTEYDEESPPSPATVETGWSNGTWTINLFEPPPDQLGVVRNITKIRLYRTLTSLAGPTTYFWIADMDVSTPTYADVITDDVIVGNFQLASQLWAPPPEGLQGIISMPNGMAVGWVGNEIWFCEPYRPHAWPASYTLTTEYPIVGLGVTGSTVVACTSGAPYIATGVAPGSMSALKIQNSEPCHSRKSILGNSEGVYYASRNGLIRVTQYGQVANSSELWITREKWQQLTSQKNLNAIFLVSQYFAMGTTRNGDTSEANRGFTIELSAQDTQSFTIWPQPGGHRMGFNLLDNPNGLLLDNLTIDHWSAVALLIQNNGVYYYDFSDPAPVSTVYTWRSKKMQQGSKKNYAAMRVQFTIPVGTPALNPVRAENATADPFWNTLPPDRYGFIRVFSGDDVLVTTREIRKPQELLRILGETKHETWYFEVTARVPISNIQVGTSVKALSQV